MTWCLCTPQPGWLNPNPCDHLPGFRNHPLTWAGFGAGSLLTQTSEHDRGRAPRFPPALSLASSRSMFHGHPRAGERDSHGAGLGHSRGRAVPGDPSSSGSTGTQMLFPCHISSQLDTSSTQSNCGKQTDLKPPPTV